MQVKNQNSFRFSDEEMKNFNENNVAIFGEGKEMTVKELILQLQKKALENSTEKEIIEVGKIIEVEKKQPENSFLLVYEKAKFDALSKIIKLSPRVKFANNPEEFFWNILSAFQAQGHLIPSKEDLEYLKSLDNE